MGNNCFEPVGCWQGAHKGKPPVFIHSPSNGRKLQSPLTPSVRTEGTFFPTEEPATKPHVGPRRPWGNSRCPLQGAPLGSSVRPAHARAHRARPPAARGLPGACGTRGAQDAGLWAPWGAGWADSPRPAPSRQPKHPRLDVGPARLWAARRDASKIWMLCDSREWEGRLDLDRTEESLPGGRRGFRAVDARRGRPGNVWLRPRGSGDVFRRRLHQTTAFLEEAELSGRLWNTPRLFLRPGGGRGADRGAQRRTPILWPHTPPTELLAGPELGSSAPHRAELRRVPTALRSSSRKDSARARVPVAGGAKPWDLAGLRFERSPGAGSRCGAG